MNPREKMIAAAIGVVLAGVLAWFALGWYFGEIDAREQKLQTAKSDLAKKKTEQRNAQLASKRLASYEERSLPPDPELAKSLYEKWLLQIAAEVEPKLPATPSIVGKLPSPVVKNTYSRLTFTVKLRGELPQVVDFLYRLQRVDWLHRIDSMNLTPQNDSRLIDVTLNISALSVTTAPRVSELKELVGEKYKDGSLADYSEPILNRNFFGAPNQPPQLDLASRTDATIDRSFELAVKATDPDVFDRVQYEMTASGDPSAKFDPKTGKLSWRPRAKGEFKFEFQAKDDGLPPRSSPPKTVTITVKDPPKVVEGPKKPGFDDAKYTVLTAVIENTGEGEIWLNVRPKGETRVLQVGDKFQIGTVKGEVSEIGTDDVLLLIDGKLRRLEVGQTLVAAETGG
jgi:hypothetical protein